MLVEVGGAGDAGGEFAQGGRFAAPEVADGVAVLSVPFRPLRREVAHLVAAGANVPRLGDELDLGDDRVLLDEFEEGGELVHVVELAGQGGGEVEAEAVHVHLGDPVAQGVHEQLQGVGLADVERVAGARVVHVVLLVALHQPVVGWLSMPLKDSVGPRWLPSAVWLYTTSRMTSMPAWCSERTMALKSWTCWPVSPVEL